jgi:hypothetical protein
MPLAPPHGGKPPGKPAGGISAAAFLSIARKALGKPYLWGGSSLAGFDCSGLVQWALTRAGVKGAPRTSEAQWGWVEHISRADLKPGDLVFEQWPGDGAAPGHVAIFTGKGRIEEAAQAGTPVHEVAWSPGQVTAAGGRIVGYGRIPGMNGAPGGAGGSSAQLTSFLSWPSDVIGAFTAAGTALDWLLQPSHWVRIICGASGAGATLAGVWALSHAGGQAGENGMAIVPRPAALPIGILLVGAGGVLLFVAFHNLPSDVSNLPALLGYLQAQAKGDATGTPAPAPTGAAADTLA